MNRYYIRFYLKTYFHPKLMSPLACSFLATKQYNSIQNNYISTALSSMGYNHTWPIALRYRDNKFCGLQLHHLERETLIKKIQQLQLLLIKLDTSKVVTTILARCQHVSGLASPILETHSHNVNYINGYWNNDFVRLLNKYDVEIKLRDNYITQIQREIDTFIM